MTALRSWLVAILIPVYRPVAKLALEFWNEANIVLSSKESVDNPGPYKRHHAIYACRFLDVFINDPQWRTLVVKKSSQSGFTLHVLTLICRVVIEKAWNFLYFIDSADKATSLSTKRLIPMLESCRATRELVRKATLNTLEYNFPNCSGRISGAGSAGQAASDPAALAIADETDKYKMPKGETHIWYLIIDRIKRAAEGKAIAFSTPTTETGIIHKCHVTGSQHCYFVPCPHCGVFQVLTWEGVRYDHCRLSNGSYDLHAVLRETFYRCESCEGRIDEDHKLEMFLAGEPRATNFKEIDGPDGKIKIPGWSPGEMSAHISDLYSLHPQSTWGHLAVEFILAQNNALLLQKFINGRLGEAVRQTVSNISQKHVLRLKSTYRRGSLPLVPCVACLSIDNQGDHQKWVSYAFLPNGDQFVIDWGRTLSLEEADDLILRPIKLPDGREIFPQRVIIDEGGKGGTSYDVRKFCFPRFPVFFPCKGRGGIQVKNTITWSNSGIDRGGIDQIPVCHFDDDAFKRELYIDLIKKHDPVRSKEFGVARLYLPSDVTEEFVRELCGEQLVKTVDENGNVVFRWEPKPPNDWGDGVKMGRVLWNIIRSEFQPVK